MKSKLPKLDKYEQSIENAIARGDFVPAKNLDDRKKMFSEAAKNYQQLQKSRPITTRINQEDLLGLKSKAQKIGIPYQTLLSALIHQFVENKISLNLLR